jgi:hypothetical protein
LESPSLKQVSLSSKKGNQLKATGHFEQIGDVKLKSSTQMIDTQAKIEKINKVILFFTAECIAL